MSDLERGSRNSHPVLKVIATFIFGTFLVTIVPGLWAYDPIRQQVCSWSHTPPRIDGLCPVEDRIVSDDQAEDWLDSMIAQVRGTQRAADVVGYVTTFSTDQNARQVFVRDWNWVLYAQRVSPVRRTNNAYNEFDAIVNVFDVPDHHRDPKTFYQTPFTEFYRIGYVFRLTHTEKDGVQALRIHHDTKTHSPMGTPNQRKVYAAVKTDNYSSFGMANDGMQNWPAGRPSWEICQLRATAGPLAGKWFARTYLGWTPHSDLKESAGRVHGVVSCDKGIR